MPDRSTFSIGEVARRAGLGIETVRFYERRGLIDDPPRQASGYRAYPSAAIRRLQFIRRAKELGFTLAEIQELLALRADSATPCGDVRRQIATKVADLDRRLADLERIRRALQRLSRECEDSDPAGECPFLEHLESGS